MGTTGRKQTEAPSRAERQAPPAEAPRFRSYFDLLDEKYPDSSAPPRVVENEIPDEWATGTGQQPLLRPRRRRRDLRAALVAALALFAGCVVLAVFLTTSGDPGGRPGEDGGVVEVDARVDPQPVGQPADAPTTEGAGIDAGARSVEGTGMAPRPEPSPRRRGPTSIGEVETAEADRRAPVRSDRAPAAPASPDPRPDDAARSPEAVTEPSPEEPSAPSVDQAPRVEPAAPEVQTSAVATRESTPEPAPATREVAAPPVVAPSAVEPSAAEPSAAASSVAEPPVLEPSRASTPEVVSAADLVAAEQVFAPQPRYPDDARRRGAQGTVVIVGTVTTDGSVRDARVLVGRDAALDRAALEAFRTWQYEPARLAGTPIESTVRAGIHFKLDRPRAVAPLPWGGDFVPPVRLEAVPPQYPREAWEAGVQGVVLLGIVVDERGRVTAAEVLQGLPMGLSEAALETVRGWTFRPATRKGRPVAVEHRVTVRFAPSS